MVADVDPATTFVSHERSLASKKPSRLKSSQAHKYALLVTPDKVGVIV